MLKKVIFYLCIFLIVITFLFTIYYIGRPYFPEIDTKKIFEPLTSHLNRKTTSTTTSKTTTTTTTTYKEPIKPTITIDQPTLTYEIGDVIQLFEGVRANDPNDGDLTHLVTVDVGNFDKNKVGEYVIVYQVVNKAGYTATASRTIIIKNTLNITNPLDLVYSVNSKFVNKGELYLKLKERPDALDVLLDVVDRDLLTNYEYRLNDSYINQQIDYYLNDQTLLLTLADHGYVQMPGETTEQFKIRLFDYFTLSELRKYAAIDAKRTTTSINTDKTNYKEDVCIMMVQFYDSQSANQLISTMNTLSEEERIQTFENLWATQYKSVLRYSITPYLDSLLDCNYQRIVYDDYVSNKDAFNFLEHIYLNLEVGQYSQKPFFYDNKFNVVYKLSKAPDKSTYDMKKFEEDLLYHKLNKTITERDVYDTLRQIRQAAGFSIYDEELSKRNQTSYVNAPRLYVIASYYKNNQNKDISTETFFNQLIRNNFVKETIKQIDLEILNSIQGLNYTETEITNKLEALKKSYFDQDLNLKYTWLGYIYAFFNAKSESDLYPMFAYEILRERYILGSDTFRGVDEIDEEYYLHDNFSLGVREFIISDVEQELANLIIKQLFEGVQEGEEAYVFLNDNPFTGINHLTTENRNTVFDQLKVKTFQTTKLQTIHSKMTVTGERLNTLSQLSEQTMGSFASDYEDGAVYLYMSLFKNAPLSKPTNFDTYTREQLDMMLRNRYNNEVTKYYEFILTLEAEKLVEENIQYHLAQLREENYIQFYQLDLQEIYYTYQDYYENIRVN